MVFSGTCGTGTVVFWNTSSVRSTLDLRSTEYSRQYVSIVRFESGKKVTFWNPPPPRGDLVG